MNSYDSANQDYKDDNVYKPIKIKKEHLEKVRALKRKRFHPILHHLHKKHRISRKTLFYVKEYGPHSNALKTITKESIKVLLFASLISSLGGVAIEKIKLLFISILPLIILLPVLNDMLGDYGTIISSRFSTMLHEDRINRNGLLKNRELHHLFVQVIVVSVILSILSAVIALFISAFADHIINFMMVIKIITITLLDTAILVTLMFIISITAGIYFYKKQEDPNNFLIPITTSIADFGNMIILFVLVKLFF